MNGKRTAGLYSLHCACGLKANVIDVLHRTSTGRETLRHVCHQCGAISWWYRTSSPREKVILIDREEKNSRTEKWPPHGWMHRHCPPRRVR